MPWPMAPPAVTMPIARPLRALNHRPVSASTGALAPTFLYGEQSLSRACRDDGAHERLRAISVRANANPADDSADVERPLPE